MDIYLAYIHFLGPDKDRCVLGAYSTEHKAKNRCDRYAKKVKGVGLNWESGVGSPDMPRPHSYEFTVMKWVLDGN